MKLSDYKSKPTLTHIQIDRPEVVENLGSKLEFYINLPFTHTQYRDFRAAATGDDPETALALMICPLILDESGEPMLESPDDVDFKVFEIVKNEVITLLGKWNTASWT